MTAIELGKFTISIEGDVVWLYITHDGEGMETSIEKLEAAIQEFYESEF
jgi:hypothetical protein